MRYHHFWLDFLVLSRNGMIRKLWLISKFMTPYTGQQIITIQLIPNISRSKDNETWLVNKIQRENINFLQKPCRKWVGETSFRPLFVFQKSFIWVNASCQHHNLNFFWQTLSWTYNKNKLYKISDCWFRDMLNFNYLIKDSGTSSSTTFCVCFLKKNISHIMFY